MTVSLILFHDVLCHDSFKAVRRLDEVAKAYGSKIQVRYKVFSSAPTVDDVKKLWNVLDVGKMEFMGLRVASDRELDDETLNPDFTGADVHAHHYLIPALCALKAAEFQGGPTAYVRMYEKLYQAFRYNVWNITHPETIVSYAAEIGLDTERFQADFESNKSLEAVIEDRLTAQIMGVSSVPILVAKERWLIYGLVPTGDLRRVIDDLLAGRNPLTG